MAKLLIVDDEPDIRALVHKYAVFSGHEATEACDGMEAVTLCRKEDFDAVILDIMMPELDGFSTCREIRKFSSVPIILLSARGEEYDKINGFECGADDYVVKPFSPRELLLRVDVVLRRTTAPAPKEPTAEGGKEIFTLGEMTVDMTARIVTAEGIPLDLSPKEYDLLFYMIRNRGVALSRERLIRDVWGYEFFGGDRTLDTHVKLLRKKLGKYSEHIITLRGVGYRFDA